MSRKTQPPVTTAKLPGPILAAIDAFQKRLVEQIGSLEPPTADAVKSELMAATRLAAAAGNLEVAIKGYDTLGKMMGLSGETHNHLHLHRTPGEMLGASDAELSEMLKLAKAKPVVALDAPTGTSGTCPDKSNPLHAAEAPEAVDLLA
jgi:hypothetical protein